MTRSQLLHQAEQAMGHRIPVHKFVYAIQARHVDPPLRKIGATHIYSERHRDQFIAWLKGRLEVAKS